MVRKVEKCPLRVTQQFLFGGGGQTRGRADTKVTEASVLDI